jgi:hypothetical protein
MFNYVHIPRSGYYLPPLLASIEGGRRILSEDEKKETGEAGKKIGRGEEQRRENKEVGCLIIVE